MTTVALKAVRCRSKYQENKPVRSDDTSASLRRGCNIIGRLRVDPFRSDGWDKVGDGGVRGSNELD